MSQGSSQDKTEKPTSKKIADARGKGQVAQSREIPSVCILLGALGVFLFASSWMYWQLCGFARGIFQDLATLRLHDISTSHSFLVVVFKQIITILAPLMTVVLFAGIAANLAQIGFLFTGKPLSPKLSRFDPIKGMKKVVSLKSLVELVKSIIKVLIVGGIAILLVRGELDNVPALMQMGIGEIISYIVRVSLKICFYTCLALIVLAALDCVYQRWQYKKDLRMTKQEIRDESKQIEGDPKIKARIRAVQLEMSRRRMMEAVPEATVVITNPTSLAIALKYDTAEMIAPRVIAKGNGFIAERIKDIARENLIPVVEHKPLAQTLYKTVEIDDFIPVELYRAVAEILAYVYKLKGMKKKN